jgi:hypothetical protein
MKLIRAVVAALAVLAPIALPAVASASADPSHVVLRDRNIFTEFYWKADPTTFCGPEAHVLGFGGFETNQNGGAPVTTSLASVSIQYFDRCTGASEAIFASADQANLTFRGLSGSETATVFPVLCDAEGCTRDLSNPIGLNLSVRGTDTTQSHLADHVHTSYYQLSFETTGVLHYGPVSGSVTFTTSAGDVLTVFPNYTDPVDPLITGAGAGGQVGSSQQTDLFVSFGN